MGRLLISFTKIAEVAKALEGRVFLRFMMILTVLILGSIFIIKAKTTG
jgi:hypothetical protein